MKIWLLKDVDADNRSNLKINARIILQKNLYAHFITKLYVNNVMNQINHNL